MIFFSNKLDPQYEGTVIQETQLLHVQNPNESEKKNPNFLVNPKLSMK